MGTLANILSEHRRELRRKAEWQRHLLVLCVFATIFSGAVALYTWIVGRFPFPIAQEFFTEHKNIGFSIANFWVGAGIAATFRIWRMRQTRIKTLIAEAFVLENDPDTAIRLILELQLGDAAWRNEQLALLAEREITKA